MVRGVRNRYIVPVQAFTSCSAQCHPNSVLSERNSDQSHHLRMETGTHNGRHTTYKRSCCAVTTATGRAGSGGAGGHHHHYRLSEIGCWWFGAMGSAWLFCHLSDTQSGLQIYDGKMKKSRSNSSSRSTNTMRQDKRHVWFKCIISIKQLNAKEAAFLLMYHKCLLCIFVHYVWWKLSVTNSLICYKCMTCEATQNENIMLLLGLLLTWQLTN